MRSLIFTVVVLIAQLPTYVSALETPEWWQERFDGFWYKEYIAATPLSLAGGAMELYHLSYYIDANIQMWLASGQTKYLDRALFYVENAISTAQVSNATNFPESQFQDGYLGWTNLEEDDEGAVPGLEFPLMESFMWRYVTHMLRLMRQTDSVYGDADYRARYETILAFTETNIWEKWCTRSIGSYIYGGARTHIVSHWAYIAMELGEITENQLIKDQAQIIHDDIDHDGIARWDDKSLRGQMVESGTSYVWSHVWEDDNAVQDVNHAGAIMGYFTESYTLGQNWSRSDMQRFASTLKDVVWPGPAYYVDGTGDGGGWFSDGWVKLGRFDEELQVMLETHMAGRGTPLYASGAVNARILSDPGFTGEFVYNANRVSMGATNTVNGLRQSQATYVSTDNGYRQARETHVLTENGYRLARSYERPTEPPEEHLEGWDDSVVPSSVMTSAGTSYLRCRAPWTATGDGEAMQVGFYMGSTYSSTESYAAIYRLNAEGTLMRLGYADIGTPTLNSFNYIDIPTGATWADGDEIMLCMLTNDAAYFGREETGGDGMRYIPLTYSGEAPASLSSAMSFVADQDVAFSLRWRDN